MYRISAKPKPVTTGFLTITAFLALSSAALAQAPGQPQQVAAAAAAPAAVPTAAAAPDAAADDGASNLAEVQITGSRIIRQGYTTPTPVTAVDIQEIQDSARPNIGETLNLLPVFQGSFTNTTQTISDTESAQTEMNLRNLNANRTLVLFDGRRLPASNTEAVPNVDLIPDALITRVDVVTGGASAVYGSDAVSGVVNYILDTKFEGIKGMLLGGVSGYGDGASEKLQLTFGTSALGGRLHLLLSGSQQYQAEIHGWQRPWNMTGVSSMQNPDYKNGSHVPQFLAAPCCVATTYPPGGLILAGPLKGTTFGPGGSVSQYDYGYGLTTPGNIQQGGSWKQSSMRGTADVSVGDTVQHYFARAGFDLNDDTEVFFQYLGASDHTVDLCCYNYYQTGIGTLYTSNPFIPASVLAQAQALNVTSFTLGTSLRYPRDTQKAVDGGIGVDDFRFTDIYVLGVKGKFDAIKTTWNWNAYAQQGVSVEDFNIPSANKEHLANAIQAVRVGSYGPGYTQAAYPNPRNLPVGSITCASNLLPLSSPLATSNCVPYNLFGTDVATPSAIDYVQDVAHLRQTDKQLIGGASITGEPFNSWAGPVSVALSAEWRHEMADGYNDPISNVTGFFSTNFFPFAGSQSVIEGALETVVPLLSKKPFAQEIDFNGAVRETKYSTSGRVTTWKMGLEWTPIDDIRFRGTWSMDIRAPNLSDLFGLSNGHGTLTDPFFNNVSAPAYTVTAGNPDLAPEKAHQAELGIVLQPSFIPGLHFSADWYRIKITGAISTVGAAFELQDCYATRVGTSYTGTSPYCSLISRNPDNSLDTVRIIPFNIASFLAQGIDYQLDYRTRLDRFVESWQGSMQLSLAATQTQKLVTDTGVPGPARVLDGAGYRNSPKWTGLANLAYDIDPFRFVITERYIGAVDASNAPGGPTYIQCYTDCPAPIPSGFQTIGYDPRIGSYFITNISAQYKFINRVGGRNATLFLSVDNLFNRDPPWNHNTPGQLFALNTNASLYNTIGLYARAGIRFRF